MAVSKNTRNNTSKTNKINPIIQEIFRNSQVSDERRQEWESATRHVETGDPSLRFPVYEHLYFLNVYAQRMVDLLREAGNRFGIDQEEAQYRQFLIQEIRSTATCGILEHMAGVEHTDAWLFQMLRIQEERNLRDPDDIYFHVQKREEERAKQGLPPRVKFLNEKPAAQTGK